MAKNSYFYHLTHEKAKF